MPQDLLLVRPFFSPTIFKDNFIHKLTITSILFQVMDRSMAELSQKFITTIGKI